jgi:hypothetical protein
MDFVKLREQFPRDCVSWRSQRLNKECTKAMALAYIDARDVMERLDEVCGPANWQDRYEVNGSKTICYLSINIMNETSDEPEWVTKADGAGDTDVEGDKGAISDAFNRAAVKWGIGRYLYDMPVIWVPCSTYEKSGRRYWKSWTKDPWSYVPDTLEKPPAVPQSSHSLRADGAWPKIMAGFDDCQTESQFDIKADKYRKAAVTKGWPGAWLDELDAEIDRRKKLWEQFPIEETPISEAAE